MEPCCGGFGDIHSADDDIKSLVLQVKPEVEKKLGKSFNVFEAVSYTFQVVAGKNYKVKVKIGENEYVHVTILKNLPCYGGKIELRETESGKTLADAF